MINILMKSHSVPHPKWDINHPFYPANSVCDLPVSDLENQIIVPPPQYKNSDTRDWDVLKRSHRGCSLKWKWDRSQHGEGGKTVPRLVKWEVSCLY